MCRISLDREQRRNAEQARIRAETHADCRGNRNARTGIRTGPEADDDLLAAHTRERALQREKKLRAVPALRGKRFVKKHFFAVANRDAAALSRGFDCERNHNAASISRVSFSRAKKRIHFASSGISSANLSAHSIAVTPSAPRYSSSPISASSCVDSSR